MPDAETMLSSALTFRGMTERDTPVPSTFASVDEALTTWTAVLAHEACAAMANLTGL
jgi:hypothetical protein